MYFIKSFELKKKSFSSLGAYGKGTVKCINGAAGLMKKRLAAEAQSSPRADGKATKDVSGRFHFLCRARLQIALMRGNGLLAISVGI